MQAFFRNSSKPNIFKRKAGDMIEKKTNRKAEKVL